MNHLMLASLVDFFKENAILSIILGVILAIILVLVIAIVVLAVKDKKKARSAEATPATEKPAAESSAAPAEQPVADKKETPVQTTEPAKEEPKPEPVKEPVKQEPVPAPVKEPVKEEPKPEPVKQEPKKEESKPAASTAKTTAAKPTAAKPAAAKTTAAKPNAEVVKGSSGKWVVLPEGEEYYFELRASNGEQMLRSNTYATVAGAKSGITTYKNNIASGNFKVIQTKSDNFLFQLLNARGTLLTVSSDYKSRASCESAIESTKRYADNAVIEVVK